MTRHFHRDGTTPHGEDWIWVFGSNLAGRHGAGAAKVARFEFDAAWGVAEGPTGRAYAIPTKDERLRTLPLEGIKESVDRFIEYALNHQDQRFFVTRIGCGLAGYHDIQIAPLFGSVPENCSLPGEWRHLIHLSPQSLRAALGS